MRILLLSLLLLPFGCATAYDTATQAEAGIAKAVAFTATAWIAYDGSHQLELVASSKTAAEAEEKLVEYRANVQLPFMNALHGAGSALKLLDDAMKDSAAAKRKDWGSLLGPAIQTVEDLVNLVKQFKLPFSVPSLTQIRREPSFAMVSQ